ncbi:MAG TPA: MlaE family lipid ABC transporter permease subunit [Candidatus Binatia bacterium]|jgi:phospholipid/cholesterol/gamma-HCH transport system permease protein
MNKPESTPSQHKAARISFAPDGMLHCEGDWTLPQLPALERQLTSLPRPQSPRLLCQAESIKAMDTGGAWLLWRTVSNLEQQGHSVNLTGLSADLAELVQTVAKNWPGTEFTKAPEPPGWLEQIGRLVAAWLPAAQSALTFVGESTTASISLLAHPGRVRWRMLLRSLQIDGFNAMPITGLLTFLMGVVIAYQGAEQLKAFGANIFIVDLVGISLLREIAPLVTAILVAGRSGSAYTAQIGTMRVTEELDALRALGISPMSLLVLPRAVALVISLPLLTVFADVVGVFGGMLIAWNQLGITFAEFLDRFEYAIVLRHYLIGIGKTPVFAVIIALVGCYQGFQVVGGVDSVGQRTTISVVQGIFLVIVCDAFFSILFSWWGV